MSQPGNLTPEVRLWRVEHETTGKGPFCAQGGTPTPWQEWEDQCTCGNRCKHPYRMPGPHQDCKVRGAACGWDRTPFGSASRCAFVTPRDLLDVVGPCYLKAAIREGFVLKVLRVPWEHHIRYKRQAVFDVDYAQPLVTIGLADVYWQH